MLIVGVLYLCSTGIFEVEMTRNNFTVFVVGLMAVLTSILFVWLNRDSQIGEHTAIKESVINYCIAAKAGDHKSLSELIAKTPRYYWDRNAGDSEEMSIDNSGRGGLKSVVPENNSDFARVNYSNLIEMKPLAWKGLIIPESDALRVRVNGDYAIVRASLKSRGSFSFENDFLLVKDRGKWSIFKIDLPLADQTFPFRTKLAF